MAITQSYFTGMDMDTSYSLRNQKKYYKLRNGALTIDEELGTGTITNINGNVYSFELPYNFDNPTSKPGLPSSGNQKVIGAGTIDEYIVLFSTDVYHGPDPTNDPFPRGVPGAPDYPVYIDRDLGVIWAFKYDEITGDVLGIDLASQPGKRLLDPVKHIVFYDRMHFNRHHPVKMIGNSESPSTKKAYFVDNYNAIRYINILEEGILEKSLSHLELVEDVVFFEPTASVVPGGSFMPGIVQYAFQMFAYGGGETKFSPASSLVNISAESYKLSSSKAFLGTVHTEPFISETDETGTDDELESENLNAGEPTDKACFINIKDFDKSFEDIRLVRIFYNTEYGTPQIDIIAEIKVTQSGTLTFIDDGKVTLGSLTQQEYAALGGVLFSAKDLSSSNNRLIAANINELYFNPLYDARAYRFDSGNKCIVTKSGDPSEFITIQADGSWVYTGTNPDIPVSGTNWTIPTEFDCVLKDTTFKYTNGGSSDFGGSGVNVTYEFDIEESMIIDSTSLNPETGGEYENSNSNRPIDEREHKAPTEFGGQEWETKYGIGFVNNYGYSNYASEINSSKLVGYQRDEVYRFGVVFFDIKGRTSFVYWIGDIHMPSMNDPGYNISKVDISGSKMTNTYSRVLYPIFTVTNSPEDAVSYQIVRVQRTESDRTIVASGLVTPCATGMEKNTDTVYQPGGSMLRRGMVKYYRSSTPNPTATIHSGKFYYSTASKSWGNLFGSNYNWHFEEPLTTNGDDYNIKYHDSLFNLWSPEISFNKTIPLSGTKLVLIGKVVKANHAEFSNRNSSGDVTHPVDLFYKAKHITSMTPAVFDLDYRNIITKETIDDKFNYGDPVKVYQHSYSHSYKHKNTDYSFRSQAGAGFIGRSTTSLEIGIAHVLADYDILYGYLKRENISQYQGSSYLERKSNRYLKASPILSVDNPVAHTFGGDTYITMFEHSRHYLVEFHRAMDWDWMEGSSQDGNAGKGFLNTCVFPVETTINVDWRSDESYSRLVSSRYLMRETKGLWEGDGDQFDQFPDAYIINYTYLRPNDIVQFQEEPKFFTKLVTDLSHRIMASDAKHDGEVSDNWLKFKPNNILDVEGTSGEVNAVQAVSSYLYFFQRKGIGVTQIDERALVNDAEGISLVLGTGDIFGKPKYISSEEGVASPMAIIKGRSGVYFYDDVSKVIGSVGANGVSDLSRLKGVRSYIKNNSTKATTYGDPDSVIAGFDPVNSIVHFTFSNTDAPNADSFTIGYDETIAEFVSLYDFIPKLYIDDYTRFITIDLDTKNQGWVHGDGNKGEFYGMTYDTTLTNFITDKSTITKVFDGIEYTHDADETLGESPDDNQTFSLIRVYNNFLDTGYNPINSKFRFRTWRAKMPRYTDPISSKSTRILGKYLKMDLVFDNAFNEPLFLQPMLTFWRPVAFIEP